MMARRRRVAAAAWVAFGIAASGSRSLTPLFSWRQGASFAVGAAGGRSAAFGPRLAARSMGLGVAASGLLPLLDLPRLLGRLLASQQTIAGFKNSISGGTHDQPRSSQRRRRSHRHFRRGSARLNPARLGGHAARR